MINLKENIWIVEFDREESMVAMHDVVILNGWENLYSGRVDEIEENKAFEWVKNYGIKNENPFHNYKINSQYTEYLFELAKDSLKSACNKEFCVIYRK